MARRYATPKFAVGDKVAYSVQFLQSIGESHSEMAHARGEVTALTVYGGAGFTLASIKWNADMPDRVNVANLAKVGPNPRFVEC